MGAAVALLLGTALAIWPAKPAAGAPSGTLAMSPTNTTLAVGDTVSITLNIAGGVAISEVQLGVSYNAAVLQVVDADAGTPGTQVLPGSFPGTDVEGAVLVNSVSSGIINFQYELDGNAEVDGSGTVATVQFEAIASGGGGLSWSTRQFIDGAGANATPSASVAVISVGSAAPTPTDTPEPTSTPTATATSTSTATPTGTPSPTTSSTPAATATRTATRTATPKGTATATKTAAPTGTARITILQDSNATPPAAAARGRQNGVDPAQAGRANGLPDAGTEGPTVKWWKWSFFLGAVMFGIAGWFFTFAMHHADREIVLLDKLDRRRRRRP